MDCGAVQLELFSAVRGTLDAAVRAGVEEHLGLCADCRRASDELTSLTAVLARHAPAEMPAPDLKDRLLARLDSETQRFAPPPGRLAVLRRTFGRLVAAAAVVAIAFVGYKVLSLTPDGGVPYASIVRSDGAVPAGESLAMDAGGRVFATLPGQILVLRTSEGATLRLSERSRIEFQGRGRMTLTQGELAAWVPKDSPVVADSWRLVVRTPQGEARVAGTRFRIETYPGTTALTVYEGSVSFAGPGGAGARDVGAGMASVIPAGRGEPTDPVASGIPAGVLSAPTPAAGIFEVRLLSDPVLDRPAARLRIAATALLERPAAAGRPAREEICPSRCQVVCEIRDAAGRSRFSRVEVEKGFGLQAAQDPREHVVVAGIPGGPFAFRLHVWDESRGLYAVSRRVEVR